MRPTGKLHLGHLVGALDNWVKLQEEYECFFMVADWHALMSEYEHTEGYGRFDVDNVIDWLAAGSTPRNPRFFSSRRSAPIWTSYDLFLPHSLWAGSSAVPLIKNNCAK